MQNIIKKSACWHIAGIKRIAIAPDTAVSSVQLFNAHTYAIGLNPDNTMGYIEAKNIEFKSDYTEEKIYEIETTCDFFTSGAEFEALFNKMKEMRFYVALTDRNNLIWLLGVGCPLHFKFVHSINKATNQYTLTFWGKSVSPPMKLAQ